MNYYASLFTLPQWADFTIYHMKKPFRCSSILLKAVSPVIRNLDTNSFTLPSIQGSVKEVFNAIFSFKEMPDDFESTDLFTATVLVLDIPKFKECIINSLKCRNSDFDEIFSLAYKLESHNVPTNDIASTIASNFDYYFQYFANDNYYESFTKEKLSFYSQVFSSPNIVTNDSHNLFKIVSCFYKMFPDVFNDSITNLAKKFLNDDVLRYLIDLQNYDLNQIKDIILEFLSKKEKLNTIYTDNIPISIDYQQSGPELDDIFKYINQNYNITEKVDVFSPNCNENHLPQNLLIRNETPESYHDYFSSSQDYPSVIFHLIGFAINPSAYTMTSTYLASNGEFPRSWRLEASINGEFTESNSILLDQVDDNSSLPKNTTNIVIPLKKSFHSYSWFKITQLKSESGYKSLNIARFGLYGELTHI